MIDFIFCAVPLDLCQYGSNRSWEIGSLPNLNLDPGLDCSKGKFGEMEDMRSSFKAFPDRTRGKKLVMEILFPSEVVTRGMQIVEDARKSSSFCGF